MVIPLNRPWQKIQWKRTARGPVINRFARTKRGPLERAITNSLRAALDFYGSPHVAEATPLEEAVVLLHAAGEVEHALLVEYLYAAWSLGSNPNATRISEIAIQEMCHFLTVQNLLLFVGSNPSMQRQDQDPSPTLDPFPFTLRSFSLPVLEDFLLTEMPPVDEMLDDQKAVMEPIIAKRNQQGTVVHPVGLIYAKLYWLFQENDSPTADWPDVASAGFEPGRHISSFPGQGTATTYQADPFVEAKWRGAYDRGGVFENVGTRAAALRTLFEIASQGEGPVAATAQQSHFSIFIDIYKNTDFGTLPSSNWPIDPFVSSQPAPDPVREANRITNPIAAALSGVFDMRYGIALASIRAALSRNRTNPSDLEIRTKYIGWAFDEMKPFVLGGAAALSRLPCKASKEGGQMVAAPTFRLDGFSLPDDQVGLDQTLFELHRRAAAAIDATLSQPVDVGIKSLLHKMQQVDKVRYPKLEV